MYTNLSEKGKIENNESICKNVFSYINILLQEKLLIYLKVRI